MGLTPAEQKAIGISYKANMAELITKTLAQKKFVWQLFWNGGNPNSQSGCCTRPIVKEGNTCATTLRSMCTANSPPQARAMMYAFSPGGCSGADPSNLTEWQQDLANFLLIRGPFAWLGHGWLGCSKTYQYPDMLNWDYGVPTGLCRETVL